MISFDTNLLMYSLNGDSPHHEAAREFFATLTPNDAEVAVCELVLVELYNLLRNPSVCDPPAAPEQAVHVVTHYRRHPTWKLVDYPGGLMDEIWDAASRPGFARRRIYDVRLALTLRHHRVTAFATTNIKDFQGFGFRRVWNPLA